MRISSSYQTAGTLMYTNEVLSLNNGVLLIEGFVSGIIILLLYFARGYFELEIYL
jgi:hypothetical protein